MKQYKKLKLCLVFLAVFVLTVPAVAADNSKRKTISFKNNVEYGIKAGSYSVPFEKAKKAYNNALNVYKDKAARIMHEKKYNKLSARNKKIIIQGARNQAVNAVGQYVAFLASRVTRNQEVKFATEGPANLLKTRVSILESLNMFFKSNTKRLHGLVDSISNATRHVASDENLKPFWQKITSEKSANNTRIKNFYTTKKDALSKRAKNEITFPTIEEKKPSIINWYAWERMNNQLTTYLQVNGVIFNRQLF